MPPPPPPPAPPATATLVGAPLQLTGVSRAGGLEIVDDGATGYIPVDNALLLWELDMRAAAGAGAAADAPLASAPRAMGVLRLQAAAAQARAARADEEGAPERAENDFAAAAATLRGRGGSLFLFGSGAEPGLRDSIVEVEPESCTTWKYDAISLMTALRADARVTGAGAPLNIRAAVFLLDGPSLALFNCGSAPGGRNSVVVMGMADFAAYTGALGVVAAADGSPDSKEDAAARVVAPSYSVVHLELPRIAVQEPGGGGGGYHTAGVSGASAVTLRRKESGKAAYEVLLIAASYETAGGEALGNVLAALSSKSLLAVATAARRSGAGAVPSYDLTGASAVVTVAPPAGPAGGSGGSGAGTSYSAVAAKFAGVAARRATVGARATDQWQVDVLAVTNPAGKASQLLQIRLQMPQNARSRVLNVEQRDLDIANAMHGLST